MYMNKLSLEAALHILDEDVAKQYEKLDKAFKKHISLVKSENEKNTRGLSQITAVRPFHYQRTRTITGDSSTKLAK
jgi:hypothetical protein